MDTKLGSLFYEIGVKPDQRGYRQVMDLIEKIKANKGNISIKIEGLEVLEKVKEDVKKFASEIAVPLKFDFSSVSKFSGQVEKATGDIVKMKDVIDKMTKQHFGGVGFDKERNAEMDMFLMKLKEIRDMSKKGSKIVDADDFKTYISSMISGIDNIGLRFSRVKREAADIMSTLERNGMKIPVALKKNMGLIDQMTDAVLPNAKARFSELLSSFYKDLGQGVLPKDAKAAAEKVAAELEALINHTVKSTKRKGSAGSLDDLFDLKGAFGAIEMLRKQVDFFNASMGNLHKVIGSSTADFGGITVSYAKILDLRVEREALGRLREFVSKEIGSLVVNLDTEKPKAAISNLIKELKDALSGSRNDLFRGFGAGLKNAASKAVEEGIKEAFEKAGRKHITLQTSNVTSSSPASAPAAPAAPAAPVSQVDGERKSKRKAKSEEEASSQKEVTEETNKTAAAQTNLNAEKEKSVKLSKEEKAAINAVLKSGVNEKHYSVGQGENVKELAKQYAMALGLGIDAIADHKGVLSFSKRFGEVYDRAVAVRGLLEKIAGKSGEADIRDGMIFGNVANAAKSIITIFDQLVNKMSEITSARAQNTPAETAVQNIGNAAQKSSEQVAMLESKLGQVAGTDFAKGIAGRIGEALTKSATNKAAAGSVTRMLNAIVGSSKDGIKSNWGVGEVTLPGLANIKGKVETLAESNPQIKDRASSFIGDINKVIDDVRTFQREYKTLWSDPANGPKVVEQQLNSISASIASVIERYQQMAREVSGLQAFNTGTPSAGNNPIDNVGKSASEATGKVENLEQALNGVAATLEALKAKGIDTSMFKRYVGPVAGPGTGTSDSIPAWLSNGEFVATAKTNEMYGKWLNMFGAMSGQTIDKAKAIEGLTTLNKIIGGNETIDKAISELESKRGVITKKTKESLSALFSSIETAGIANGVSANTAALNAETAALNKNTEAQKANANARNNNTGTTTTKPAATGGSLHVEEKIGKDKLKDLELLMHYAEKLNNELSRLESASGKRATSGRIVEELSSRYRGMFSEMLKIDNNNDAALFLRNNIDALHNIRSTASFAIEAQRSSNSRAKESARDVAEYVKQLQEYQKSGNGGDITGMTLKSLTALSNELKAAGRDYDKVNAIMKAYGMTAEQIAADIDRAKEAQRRYNEEMARMNAGGNNTARRADAEYAFGQHYTNVVFRSGDKDYANYRNAAVAANEMFSPGIMPEYNRLISETVSKYDELRASVEKTKAQNGVTSAMEVELDKWQKYIMVLQRFNGDIMMMQALMATSGQKVKDLNSSWSISSNWDKRAQAERDATHASAQTEMKDLERVRAAYDEFFKKLTVEYKRLEILKNTTFASGQKWYGLDLDTSAPLAKVRELQAEIDALKRDAQNGTISASEFVTKASALFDGRHFELGRYEADRQFRVIKEQTKEAARAQQNANRTAAEPKIMSDTEANQKLLVMIERVEAAYQKAALAAQNKATAGERTDKALANLEAELALLRQLAAAYENGLKFGASFSKEAKDAMAKATGVMTEANALQSQQRSINAMKDAWDINRGALQGYNSQFAETIRQTMSLDYQFSQLGMTIQNSLSIYGLQQFAQSIISVGGELEKMQLAMNSILGDVYRSSDIYNKISDLSMVSPFTVDELMKYTKQLSAFGIKYRDLYDTTKRLSDIAAGTGVEFGRIAYEYGQMQTTGWLDARHLRMFAMSGIPLLSELSKFYTERMGKEVSTHDVRKMITERNVSAEDVKTILWNMTDDGGKFFNMQEIMAESLASKYANLRNAWNLMLGDMAKGAPGDMLKELATALTKMTEMWKQAANVIGTMLALKAVNVLLNPARIAVAVTGDLSSSFVNTARAASAADAKILKIAASYRTLTAAERLALNAGIRNKDIVSAAAERRLTKEMLAQAYMRGGITKDQVRLASATMWATGGQGFSGKEMRNILNPKFPWTKKMNPSQLFRSISERFYKDFYVSNGFGNDINKASLYAANNAGRDIRNGLSGRLFASDFGGSYFFNQMARNGGTVKDLRSMVKSGLVSRDIFSGMNPEQTVAYLKKIGASFGDIKRLTADGLLPKNFFSSMPKEQQLSTLRSLGYNFKQIKTLWKSGVIDRGTFAGLAREIGYTNSQIAMTVKGFGFLRRAGMTAATGLSRAFMGLRSIVTSARAGIMGMGAAFKEMLANPYIWIMVAIGAITNGVLSMKGKAAELNRAIDEAKHRAEEEFRDIKKAAEELDIDITIKTHVEASDFAGESEDDMRKKIASLRETLQDQDINFGETFNKAFEVDANGDYIRTYQEQLEILTNRFYEVAEAKEKFAAIAGISTDASEDTDGWFDEGLVANLEDYRKAIATVRGSMNSKEDKEQLLSALRGELGDVNSIDDGIKELIKTRSSLQEIDKKYHWASGDFIEGAINYDRQLKTATEDLDIFAESIKDRAKKMGLDIAKDADKFAVTMDVYAWMNSNDIKGDARTLLIDYLEGKGVITTRVEFQTKKENNFTDLQRKMINGIEALDLNLIKNKESDEYKQAFNDRQELSRIFSKAKSTDGTFEETEKSAKKYKETIDRLGASYAKIAEESKKSGISMSEAANKLGLQDILTDYEHAARMSQYLVLFSKNAIDGGNAFQKLAFEAIKADLGFEEAEDGAKKFSTTLFTKYAVAVSKAIVSSGNLSDILSGIGKVKKEVEDKLSAVADKYYSIALNAEAAGQSVDEFVSANSENYDILKATVDQYTELADAIGKIRAAMEAVSSLNTGQQSGMLDVVGKYEGRNHVVDSIADKKPFAGKEAEAAETTRIREAISKSHKIGDVASNVNTLYNEYQGQIEKYSAAYKAGTLSDDAKSQYDMYMRLIELLKDVAKKGGFKLDLKKKSGDKSAIQRLNEELQVAEKVRQELESFTRLYQEQGYGLDDARSLAYKKISESGMLSSFKNMVFKNDEEYIAYLNSLHSRVKSALAEEGEEDSKKSILSRIMELVNLKIPHDILEKTVGFENARRDIAESEISRRYDNRKTLKEAGLSESQASAVTNTYDMPDTYAEYLRGKIVDAQKKIGNNDSIGDLLKMSEEEISYNINREVAYYVQKYREEIIKNFDEYSKLFLDISKQGQSYADKVEEIRREAQKKRKAIAAQPNLTEDERNAYNTKVDEEERLKIMEASDNYFELFETPLLMSAEAARRFAGSLKNQLLKCLVSGSITAAEYSQKIQQINDQMEKLQGRQNNLFAYLKGGLNGLFENIKKRREEADKLDARNQSNESQTGIGSVIDESAADANIPDANNAANKGLSKISGTGKTLGGDGANAGAGGAISAVGLIDMIIHAIDGLVQGLKGMFDDLDSMYDALGKSYDKNSSGRTFMDAFAASSKEATAGWDSFKNGDIGGTIKGVVGSWTSVWTTFAKHHDAALQEEIDNAKKRLEIAKQEADVLKGVDSAVSNATNAWERYAAATRRMAARSSSVGAPVDDLTSEFISGNPVGRFLHGLREVRDRYRKTALEMVGITEQSFAIASDTGKSYMAQYMSLLAQQEEAQNQLKAEAEKKDRDDSAMREYQNQIRELEMQISDFVSNMYKELYDIDLNSWASDISNALVNAFVNGENAAIAFKNTVSNLMRQIVSKVAENYILEKWVNGLMTDLFGEDGKSGILTINNPQEGAQEAMRKIQSFANQYGPEIQTFVKELVDGLESQGIKFDDDDAGGLSKSVSGMTEDTADTLAAYANGIYANTTNELIAVESILEHIEGMHSLMDGGYDYSGGESSQMRARGFFDSSDYGTPDYDIVDLSTIETSLLMMSLEQLPQLNAIANAQLTQLNMQTEYLRIIQENTASNIRLLRDVRDDLHGAATGTKPLRVS